MKYIILIGIVGLLLLGGCFPQDIVVTAWHDSICNGEPCMSGRSFYSWSEAEAWCKANNYNCSYTPNR